MVGGDEVAHVYVRISADDSGVLPTIEKVRAELEALDKAGRKEIKAKLGLDTSEFNRKLAEAKSRLAAQEARLDRTKSGGAANRDAARQIREIREEIRRLNAEKRAFGDWRSAVNEVIKAVDIEQDELERSRKNNEKDVAERKKQSAERIKTIRQENEEAERLHGQALEENKRFDARRAREAETQTRKVNKAHAEALKLDREYNSAKFREMWSGAMDRLKAQQAANDRERKNSVEHRAAMSREANVAISDIAGRENWGKNDRAVRQMFDRRHRTFKDNFNRVFREESRLWSRLTNSSSLEETFRKTLREPVRLGPFSATPKGLVTGLSALGPLIMTITGGLTAMAGTVAGALTGALSVGTAAVMGFGQGILGVSGVLSPYISDLQIASQATDAYSKAVYKYGVNSEQAKTKQKQLNSVLASMSPTARRAFKDFSAARAEFANQTRATRPMLDKALGETMKTVRALSPDFSKNTVGTVDVLTRSLGQGMGWLRKEERGGKGFLNTTFRNANAALGPLLSGVGRLAAALGNIGASASRHLKPMAEGFRRIMGDFFNSTKNKNSLNSTIDSLMKDLSSVNRFLGSTFRLFRDLFNVGRESGRGLFDSLTSTFNRWDRFIRNNPEKMRDFFRNAAEGFRTIAGFIKTFAQAFVTITRVVAPLAAGFAKVIQGIDKVAGAFMSLKGSVWVLRAIGAGLATWLVASKILGLTMAILKFQAAVRLASIAMKGMTGWNAAMTGLAAMQTAQMMPAGVVMRNAKRAGSAGEASLRTQAAASIERNALRNAAVEGGAMGAAMAGAGRGMTLLATGARLMMGPLGIVTAVVGASVLSFANQKKAVNESAEALKKWNNSSDPTNSRMAVDTNIQRSADAYRNLRSTILSVAEAQRIYNETPTKENKINLNEAKGDQYKAFNEYKASMRAAMGPIDKQIEEQNRASRNAAKNMYGAERQGYRDLAEDYRKQMVQAQRTADQLRATKKAYLDFSEARFKQGLGGFDTKALYESLGKIRGLVNNEKITAKIATMVGSPENMAQVQKQIEGALNRKVPLKKILLAISGAKDLDDLLKKLSQLSGIPAQKTISLNVTGNAQSRILAIRNGINSLSGKTVYVNTVQTTTKRTRTVDVAEGGKVVPAASGYTKDTAAASAMRRPRRRAMGAFGEPTLLVGEENRTEYVIATNPAYRTQNKRYLEAAASDLGMVVVEGARYGRAPYSKAELAYGRKKVAEAKSRRQQPRSVGYYIDQRRRAAATRRREEEKARSGFWADALLGNTDTAGQLKRGEKRLKLLRRKRNEWNQRRTKPKPGTAAYITHQREMRELRGLERSFKYGYYKSLKYSVRPRANTVTYQKQRIEELEADMTLAEKRGDARAFKNAKDREATFLRKLISEYLTAEKYATGTRRSKLATERKGLEDKLIDLRAKAMGDSTGLKDAEIAKQNALITSLRNSGTISNAFASVAGGMLTEAFSGPLAAGGPRMSSKGGVTVNINTLVPGDPNTLSAVASAATGGLGLQGAVQSPRTTVAI